MRLTDLFRLLPCFLAMFLAFLFCDSQVLPLLSTTWNQGCNYNDSCPPDGAGPCGNVYTGCNATAIAQILKFHQHPVNGWGSYSYSSTYGTLSANFAVANYNYSLMPNSPGSPNPEIAKLMYHAGVAVDMIYSPSVSNSFFDSQIFIKYFKYSPKITGALKSMYTNSAWEYLLKTEINNGRVVFVKGGNHFYLVDGYQISPSLKFHMNFGWGGLYNGYYDLHNVVVASTNFTPGQAMINIEPLTGLELNTDSVNVTASGGSVSFLLSSLSSWNANSGALWITPALISAGEGFFDYGNGASAAVTANLSYSPRYGDITFTTAADTAVLVVCQSGITPSLGVSNSNLTFPSGNSIQTANVSSDSSWNAVTSYVWISTNPVSDSGNATLDITCAANPSPATRFGTVIVSRGSLQSVINITQAGSGSFWCIPALVTPNSTGIANVTLNTINRTSAIDEGYVLTGDTTMLKLDSSYTLYVTFSGGNAPAVWIDWNLDGDFADPGEPVMSPSGTWYPSFSSTKNVTFTVPDTAAEGFTRMRIYAKEFGTGPVTGPCNTTDNGGCIEDYTIQVKDHRHMEVSPSPLNYVSNGATQSLFAVSDSSWNVSTTAGWLSLSTISGIGLDTVDVTANMNPSVIPRSGIVSFFRGIKTASVIVKQDGADTLLAFDADTIWFPSAGDIKPFGIQSNVPWTTGSSQTWATTSTTSGTDSISVDAIVSNNPANVIRSALIVAVAGTRRDTLYLFQDSSSSVLSASPPAIHFLSPGGSDSIILTTATSWTATLSDSWFNLSQISGSQGGTLFIQCDTNLSAVSRSGTIQFTNGLVSTVVTVSQDSTFIIGQNGEPNDNVWKVYPVPADDVLNLRYLKSGRQETVFVLLDVQGREIIQSVLTGENAGIDISNMPGGVYMIHDGKGSYRKVLIK